MVKQSSNYLNLNKIIHETNRLRIMALLASVEQAEFKVLRDELVLTDGNLSTHLQVLEQAGYIQSSKEFIDRKVKSWYTITEEGHQAFSAYVVVMQQILREHYREEV